MGEILNFPRDTERYKIFVRESNIHGAKLEIRTFKWLVERYTKPGDIILDPMSGIGTVHLAATMHRPTIAIELVEEFQIVHLMNIEKLQTDYPGSAPMILLKGDCRKYLPLQTLADHCIFSPPYGDVMKKAKKKEEDGWMERKHIAMGYGDEFANVGQQGIYPIYLESMAIIYKLVFDSLKPGGIIASVVKDYVKGGERVYCSTDNLRIMLEAGFMLEDWHRRYTDPKIFQILAERRRQEQGMFLPELKIVWEDILVCRKPNG